MSNTNDFLPFCATDTGTNLLSQSAYIVAADRPIGNQPGIASSNLVNKALRQPTFVASQFAQYISNQANVSTLDNANTAQFLSQIQAALMPLPSVINAILSGTSNWNSTFYFFVSSANATAGATYTNNAVTFTVVNTISGGVVLQTTGNGSPSAGGGVLSISTGTGDSTITYYAFRSPSVLKVRAVGAGAGGGGGNGNPGGAGSDTTFGTSLIVAGGAPAQSANYEYGPGGSASLGSGPVGIAVVGGNGCGGMAAPQGSGGIGGSSPFGGAGGGGNPASGSVGAGADNTGGGGGGGYADSSYSGGGGGAGGYVECWIYSPLFTYAYSIGAGGIAGTAGSGTVGPGAAGGSGIVIVEQYF